MGMVNGRREGKAIGKNIRWEGGRQKGRTRRDGIEESCTGSEDGRSGGRRMIKWGEEEGEKEDNLG